jgi:hypothetical protein
MEMVPLNGSLVGAEVGASVITGGFVAATGGWVSAGVVGVLQAVRTRVPATSRASMEYRVFFILFS